MQKFILSFSLATLVQEHKAALSRFYITLIIISYSYEQKMNDNNKQKPDKNSG